METKAIICIIQILLHLLVKDPWVKYSPKKVCINLIYVIKTFVNFKLILIDKKKGNKGLNPKTKKNF